MGTVNAAGGQGMGRRIAIAAVIAAVLLTFIGFYAYAADDTQGSCGTNLTWSYDSGTLTITGYGEMKDYGSSSSSAAPWYGYRDEITQVKLDCTNTSVGIGIGTYAFYKCTALESVSGDTYMTSIDSYAFSQCSSLSGLDISEAVSLGDSAFYGNSSMTEVTVNAAVTEIPEFLFQKCTSLEKVVLLGDVTSIGNGAFLQCEMLDTLVYSETDTRKDVIYIADTVQTIGTQAFSLCVSYDDDNEPAGGISTVVFEGDSVTFTAATKNNYSQFYKCEYLTSITMPAKQTQITPWLFYGCAALESIDIPDTVTSIGKYAFSTTGLTSVEIPAAVTELGSYAFSGDTALAGVTFAQGSALAAIPDYAFSDTAIDTITLPDSAESVGTYAFKGCTALTEVTFGSALTTLGSSIFYGCTSELALHFTGEYTYTDADGNEAEMTISDTAFNGITGIGYYPADSTTWPAGTAVSAGEIYGATSFIWAMEGETVEFVDWYTLDEETGTLYIYRDGNMPNYAQGTAPWYSSRASIENIVFGYNPADPDGTYTITSIGSYAFCGFTALESVTIPASVTSIGSHAFYNSQATRSAGTTSGYAGSSYEAVEVTGGLTVVGFEEGSTLTKVGSYAFANCGNLYEITLPESLQEIGDFAFYQCGSSYSTADLVYTLGSGDLSGVTVTAVGTQSTFRELRINSSDLTSGTDYTLETSTDARNRIVVMITLSESYLESLEAGEYSGSITFGTNSSDSFGFNLYIYDESTDDADKVAYQTIITATGLTQIDLSAVTAIGTGAFQECVLLTDVTFGSSLQTIGTKAFYGCEALADVTLPDSVQEIGNYAFGDTGLEQLVLPAGVTTGSYAFSGCVALSDLTFASDGDGVTLGAYSFEGCTSLVDVTLPSEITVVSQGLFCDSSNIQTVVLEGKVTQIGADAFSGCTALESVTGLSDVEMIGDSAFYDCSALTGLHLPESLVNDDVGDFAFYRCAGLADENGFVVINGVLYSYVYSILGIDIQNYMTGVGNQDDDSERVDVSIETQTVPDEVTEIANYAFYQIFATAGGTSSTVSTVTLEGLEFNCAADEITFEEYAFAGLPLLAGYSGYTATIVYPCDDAKDWIAKLDAYGLTGTGESLGYRYSTSWALETAVGHKQGEVSETVEPTCTEDGSITYTCTRCGETVTETIPATGHTYDTYEVTKEATCTEEGQIPIPARSAARK